MSLLEHFEKVEDPRRSVGMRTNLRQILGMVTLSYLCGYTGYRPVARFCSVYSDLMTEIFALRHGVPSHVTFREVLMNVDQKSLINAFNSWASNYVKISSENWVSADGKTLNSTVSDCHGKDQNFQAVVSLFCQESGLVFAINEYKNKDKGKGETSVLRFLLEQLEGMGITLSVDALHTQKND